MNITSKSLVNVLPNPGPVACCSKAIKQAKLVVRKFCFILDASKGGGGGRGQTPVQRPALPYWQLVDKSIYRQGVGGYMQKQHSQLLQASWSWSSVVRPVSSWLFQVQLVFRSRIGLFPIEANYWNYSNLCHGYSLFIMLSTSSTWWEFPYL